MPATAAKMPSRAMVQWPDPADHERVVHTSVRLKLLSEDWDQVCVDYIRDLIGEEAAEVTGIPDTSANPLADLSRQLSTPGLFGFESHLGHMDASADPLISPDGLLAGAGLWPMMQEVEYLARGAGDCFMRVDYTAKGAVKLRIVHPTNVWLRADPSCPTEAVELWELRLRWLPSMERWVYAWDCYDISDPENPTFRVLEDGRADGKREDITNLVLPEGAQASGEAYPYRFADGTPFIPFVQYSDRIDGQVWHWRAKKGVHRGTLNTAFNWTMAQRGLRSASGRAVIVWGLQALGAEVVTTKSGRKVTTAPILPGSMAFMKPDGTELAPNVVEVGPGANLAELHAYCEAYEMKQAVRYGLNPADVHRQHSNPSSGASLFVAQRGKRDMQRQATPVFRPKVLELVRKAAALVNRGEGAAVVPEGGYTWRPEPIPDSPEEMAERREDTDWQTERGFLSPVEAFRRFNPGTSDEMALEAIVRARVDQARIEAAVAEALAAEDLANEQGAPPAEPEPPQTPAPPPAQE